MTEQLGAHLVRKGLITQAQWDEAQKSQLIYGGSLGTNLVELGYIDLMTLGQALSDTHHVPLVTDAELEAVPAETLALLKPELARNHLAFPLALEGRRLRVAMVDPQDPRHVDALGFATGMRIVPSIVSELRLFQLLEKRYGIPKPLRPNRPGQPKPSGAMGTSSGAAPRPPPPTPGPPAGMKPTLPGTPPAPAPAGVVGKPPISLSGVPIAPGPSGAVPPGTSSPKPAFPPGGPPVGAMPPRPSAPGVPGSPPVGAMPPRPMSAAPLGAAGVPVAAKPLGGPPPPGVAAPFSGNLPPGMMQRTGPGVAPPGAPLASPGPGGAPLAGGPPRPAPAMPVAAPGGAPGRPPHPGTMPMPPGAQVSVGTLAVARPPPGGTAPGVAPVPPAAARPASLPPVPGPSPKPVPPPPGVAQPMSAASRVVTSPGVPAPSLPPRAPTAPAPAPVAPPPVATAPSVAPPGVVRPAPVVEPVVSTPAPSPDDWLMEPPVAASPDIARKMEEAVVPVTVEVTSAPALSPVEMLPAPEASPVVEVPASKAPARESEVVVAPVPIAPPVTVEVRLPVPAPAVARATAPPAEVPAAPVPLAAAGTTDGAAGWRPRSLAVEPVELPSEPTGEMEVSSQYDPSELASDTSSSWAQRAIEVDFSSQDAGASGGEDFNAPGGVPLASVLDFVPSWDPSAESAQGAESVLGGAQRSPDEGGQRVQFQEAVEALRQATTRGELGTALLSYVQGRFPRGFLLGETFGSARVGRAYGPGSDKPEVAALLVDLEAPSLLAMAAYQGGPVVSSVPESQVDEALFAALGESFSHLMAVPLRLRARPVGFVVVDGGPSPFGPEELEEMGRLLVEASEACDRLHDVS